MKPQLPITAVVTPKAGDEIGVTLEPNFCTEARFRITIKDIFKNGVVPEQPGLKHDFLPEVVKRAHREGLLVVGYFCAGSNTRWGQTRPELSYGFPSAPHIPYTDEYLAYLDAAEQPLVELSASGLPFNCGNWRTPGGANA